ncbi:MAG TPA: hypothetical protein VK919_05205 [Solirubrobacterales bacterium]|nr:hypothetical protein [Solirubrobacterales bacterium]
MIGFRLAAQKPPEPKPVADGVVMRLEHVYEVDPALMVDHIQQLDFPVWRTNRTVANRWDHLAWMHDHWADTVIHGEELLEEIERED